MFAFFKRAKQVLLFELEIIFSSFGYNVLYKYCGIDYPNSLVENSAQTRLVKPQFFKTNTQNFAML